MRIFKTRAFQRWAGKAGVSDSALLDAVAKMECGLIDADLGGNLYKQRVALPGRDKSGSTRTVIATRFAGVLFFGDDARAARHCAGWASFNRGNTMSRMINEALETMRDLQQIGAVSKQTLRDFEAQALPAPAYTAQAIRRLREHLKTKSASSHCGAGASSY